MMARCARRPAENSALARCLEQLGWAPTTLARKINKLAGPGTVSLTAPYYWLRTGGVPRAPVATLTAVVLSRHLGRPVSVEVLWPDRAGGSPLLLPADIGMHVSWSATGALRILEDWLLGGLMDRRTFLAVSGPALTGLAWACMDLEPAPVDALHPDELGGTLVEQAEAAAPALWALDDRHGGERVLPHVSAQLQTVATLLRDGGHRGQAGRRLFRVAALLSQHAGWTAFDAGKHGLAQRHLLTGLHTAHQAGDLSLRAHILADLAYQAGSRDLADDAGHLAEAAVRAAERTPPRVRASVNSRAAFAHAVAGDPTRAAASSAAAHEQLTAEGTGGRPPDWAYYLTGGHVDALAGAGLVSLARQARRQGLTRRARGYLRDGVRLAAANAAGHDLDHPHQRVAAVEGAWLSLAWTLSGELEQACQAGHRVLDRLRSVRSARCLDVLATVRSELRRGRMQNVEVRQFIPHLERALPGRTA